MTYYSQCQQDKILNEQIFKNNKNGFYVDVGAHHPTRISNTCFYEKTLNWKGICIEPQEKFYKLLEKERDCILIKHGVYNKKTTLEFCTAVNGLTGIVETYEPRHLERIKRESKKDDLSDTFVRLEVDTLESVFDKHNVKIVDYMSLDVEGSEYEVLQGINYNKVKINIIDLEDNYPNSEKSKKINTFLVEKNFRYIGNIEFDRIYMNNNKKFSWE